MPRAHRRLIRALHAAVFGGDTIYLCVVDARGMAVSLNQSLFQAFGSGVVVPGTGVLLHNRGAYHTRASYRGGARPIHTLSPALALADGRPRLVFGTMGGEGQVQIHLQLLFAHPDRRPVARRRDRRAALDVRSHDARSWRTVSWWMRRPA